MKKLLIILLTLITTSVFAGDIIVLVKTSDREGVASVEDAKAHTWRSGYIFNQYPTNTIFSAKEKNISNFVRLKINEDEWDDSWIESVVTNGEVALLRKVYVDFYKIFPAHFIDFYATLDKNYTACGKYKDFDCNCPICDVGIWPVTNLASAIVENVWTNRPHKWVAHDSAGTYTIRAAGGDYSSLSTWAASEQCDLTVDGGQGLCIAECYNDWVGGLEDTVYINGWTTDADNYVKIYTPKSERHNGIMFTDYQRYTGFAIRCNKANTQPFATINIEQAYTRVEGLLIDADLKGNMNGVRIKADYARLTDCIIANSHTAGVRAQGFGTTIPCLIANCVIFNNVGKGLQMLESVVAYNVTSGYNADYGFISEGSFANTTLINCIGDENHLGDFVLDEGSVEISYCSSSDDTADNYNGTNNRINQTFSFVYPHPFGNYHLKSDDTGAINHGTNLSDIGVFSFDTDFDGNYRKGTWDIGADQYHQPYRILGYTGTNVVWTRTPISGSDYRLNWAKK